MTTWIAVTHRIVVAISKQVIAGDAAVGAEVGGVIGADETAEFGVVISALQVVQAGLLVEDLAIVAKKEVLRPPPGEGSFALLNYTLISKNRQGVFDKAGGWGSAHPPAGLLSAHRQLNRQETEQSPG